MLCRVIAAGTYHQLHQTPPLTDNRSVCMRSGCRRLGFRGPGLLHICFKPHRAVRRSFLGCCSVLRCGCRICVDGCRVCRFPRLHFLLGSEQASASSSITNLASGSVRTWMGQALIAATTSRVGTWQQRQHRLKNFSFKSCQLPDSEILLHARLRGKAMCCVRHCVVRVA